VPESAKAVAERAVESFNREFAAGRTGIDADTRDLWAPEPVIVPFRAALEGTEYSGPSALDDFAAATRESWAWIQIDPQEIREFDAGRVLIVGELVGEGRETGAEISASIALLLTAREGRMAEIHTFTSERDALAEAGR
jgi:ketosteroid isomerase-like protein